MFRIVENRIIKKKSTSGGANAFNSERVKITEKCCKTKICFKKFANTTSDSIRRFTKNDNYI